MAHISSILKFQCNVSNKNVDLQFLSEDTKIIRKNTITNREKNYSEKCYTIGKLIPHSITPDN